MRIFRKFAGVVLALAMVQGVAVGTVAVNSPSANVSAATATGEVRTYSLYIGVGQTRSVSEVVYIPCRATYSTLPGCTCLKVDSRGNITGIRAGGGTINAVGDNGITYRFYIDTRDAPNAIVLDKSSVTRNEGESFWLTAIIPSPNISPGKIRDVATWTSSDKSIATVTQKGCVKCIKKGTATITVKTYNGKTATCKVNVNGNKIEPQSVTISPNTYTLIIGDKTTIKATVTPSNAVTTLTWSSSNTAVAKVDSKGVVTPIKSGTATIKVVTSNGKASTCKVTVKTKKDYIVDEIIRLVNVERKKAGLNAVVKNTTLCNLADIRSYEVSDKDANGVNYFKHERRDGRPWWTILDENNYDYTKGGENIAAGYKTPEAVMNGWMNSEPHRKNILNPNFTKLGVGYFYYENSDYKTFYTQLFSN